jgi:acetyltransferase
MRSVGSRPDRVRIRPIEAGDDIELARFYSRLSEDSRRLRFFAVTRGLSPTQSAGFCSPDHGHREGFVATLADGPSDVTRIVGHVCLEPAGTRRAEVAIAVADELQRAGIGRRLMAAAVGWARHAGVDTLTATMLASNPGIHRLLASLGMPERTAVADADTSTIEIAIPAVPARAA